LQHHAHQSIKRRTLLKTTQEKKVLKIFNYMIKYIYSTFI